MAATASSGLKRRRPHLYELNEGEKAPDIVGLGDDRDRSQQRRRREMSQMPLSRRLAAQESIRGGASDRSQTRVVVDANEGTTREMTFVVGKMANGKAHKEESAPHHSDEMGDRHSKRGIDSLGLSKVWDGKKRSRGGGRANIG
jgi:hypothetical protein